ncbi:MAG: hypothetical protein U0235_27240 [Polyangiaceae bacterium]
MPIGHRRDEALDRRGVVRARAPRPAQPFAPRRALLVEARDPPEKASDATYKFSSIFAFHEVIAVGDVVRDGRRW